MSWLTDIAGKAETLLNKIDKNAALLVDATVDGEEPKSMIDTEISDGGFFETFPSGDKDALQTKSVPSNPMTNKKIQKKVKLNSINEEELIKFLNEPIPAREVNTSNNKILEENDLLEPVTGEVVMEDFSFFETAEDEICDQPIIIHTNGSEKMVDNDMVFVPKVEPVSTEEETNPEILKELTSLAQELGVVETRAKNAEKECESLRKILETKRSELRQRERRLQESLENLEEMKKHNEELENEVKTMKSKSVIDQEKIDNLNREVQKNSDDLEKEKNISMEQLQKSQDSFLQIIKSLEEDLSTMRAINRKHDETNQRKDLEFQELQQKWKLSQTEAIEMRQEFEEYKAKAKRVLQEKEKLISSYDETDPASLSSNPRLSPSYYQAQLEQVINERDVFRDEVQQLSLHLTHSKQEATEMEKQWILKSDEYLRAARELELNLQDAKCSQTRTETELRNREAEVCYLQEELTRQKIEMATKIKEMENEANIWKNKMNFPARPINPSANDESSQEARITFLTETLIQKQNLLEAVTSEKTSVVLKMEKLQSDLEELRVQVHESHNPSSNFESESSLVSLFESNGRVRKAYTSLDKLSTRIGATLRRYPMARIFVLLYMCCLHLWVFFVLLHSTSELTLPPAK